MGRKNALYVSIFLIYVANIIMMTTDSIAGLYVGRLIIGFGNGILMTFSQLYIQVDTLHTIRFSTRQKTKQIFHRSVPPPATEP